MGLFDFLIACVLAVIGGALTFVLAKLILLQVLGLVGLLRVGGGKGKIHKAVSRIESADVYIQAAQFGRAAEELEKSFLIDAPASKELILMTREHNQNVLSRCLIVAEEQNFRIDNIAEVERLLSIRVDLQLSVARTKETLREFEAKRKMKGKKTPAWGTNEFVSKIKSHQQELKTNKTQLAAAIKSLFKTLQTQEKQDDIVYH